MAKINLIKGSEKTKAERSSSQRVINMYPSEVNGKTVLMPCPGAKTYNDDWGNMVVRRVWPTVKNNNFYALTQDGANGYAIHKFSTSAITQITTLPSLASTMAYVDLAEGFTNIAFYGGFSNIVAWDDDDPSNTISNVTGVGGLNLITYHNYFLYSNYTTRNFFWSSPDNPTSWDALDFATAEFSGDNIVLMRVIKDQLWIFGTTTTEMWYDTGDANAPFQKIPGGVIQVGAMDKKASAYVGDELAFLASNDAGEVFVALTNGNGYRKISNEFVDTEIAKRTISSTATPTGTWYFFTYPGVDRTFLCCNYRYNAAAGTEGTRDSITLVWDSKTALWHERTTGEANSWQFMDSATLRSGLYSKPVTVVCSDAFYSGYNANNYVVNQIDPDTHQEYYCNTWSNIKKTIITDPVSVEDKTLFHHRLRIDAQTVNSASTDYDPTTMYSWTGTHANVKLSYSDLDAGTNVTAQWQAISPEKSFGFSNTAIKRVEWFRLGSSEHRRYRVESNSDAPLYISDCFVDVTPGNF